MPGRRPKPSQIRKIEGNPGKRPFNRFEPHPEIQIPEIPAHLDEGARREWARITPLLRDQGIISDLDLPAIASYCQCYSRWQAAEEDLKRRGLFYLNYRKKRVQNPNYKIANKAIDQIRRFAIEFGMTPAARSKVQVHPRENPDANFQSLLSGPTLTETEKKKLQ